MWIDLPEREQQAVCDLALDQWRTPRDQAVYLIVDGLRRAGALPAELRALDDRQPAEPELVR
jgi:hypothetical protein